MKKNKIIVGSLLLLGVALGFYAVMQKPHEAKEKDCGCGCGGSCSDDKQANASGNFPGKPNQAENCAVCKDAQTGLTYHTSENRSCKRGDTCMSKYSILQS